MHLKLDRVSPLPRRVGASLIGVWAFSTNLAILVSRNVFHYAKSMLRKNVPILQIYCSVKLDGAINYDNTYRIFMMIGATVGLIANMCLFYGALR